MRFYNNVMPWQSWIIQKRAKIILVFKTAYWSLVLVWLVGNWQVYQGSVRWFEWAILAGESAIVSYILTLLPGMAGRYGVRHPVLQVLTMFRRYIGILTFLFVLTHLSWVWGVSWVSSVLGGSEIFWPWFLLAGLGAASLLLLMFLTSNDLAVRKLGPWWKRVHSVTYVIVWLIFLHTSLQAWNVWSVLIGTAAVMEVGSWGWVWWKRQKALNRESIN